MSIYDLVMKFGEAITPTVPVFGDGTNYGEVYKVSDDSPFIDTLLPAFSVFYCNGTVPDQNSKLFGFDITGADSYWYGFVTGAANFSAYNVLSTGDAQTFPLSLTSNTWVDVASNASGITVNSVNDQAYAMTRTDSGKVLQVCNQGEDSTPSEMSFTRFALENYSTSTVIMDFLDFTPTLVGSDYVIYDDTGDYYMKVITVTSPPAPSYDAVTKEETGTSANPVPPTRVTSAPSGATVVTNYSELVAALNSAATNIWINSGTYTLTTTLAFTGNKNIYGADNVFIDGAGIHSIVKGTALNMLWQNITFQNFGEGYFVALDNVAYEYCTFRTVKLSAFNLIRCEQIRIENCTFYQTGKSLTVNVSFQGCGVYASECNDVVIKYNDFIETNGHGSLYFLDCTGLDVNHNYFNKPYYRAVEFYETGSFGSVNDNFIEWCGFLNTTGSGVGCNGIFAHPNCIGISALRNNIQNVYENAIEGAIGEVAYNYVLNTGLAYTTTHITPSPEGMYMYPSGTGTLNWHHNTIENPGTDGIKSWYSGITSNMTINANTIMNDSDTDKFGVNIIGTSGANNITVTNNTIDGFTTGVFVSSPQTNCTISGNIIT